ncbi:ABC transporter substrate-binding protein [Nonomuraea wenchangensis]|uniref:ABC transporter substrate-binding protein n=1 Tax=Nonomuraea wenchangensis TaxID=568860 RepID=UPI00331F2027
MKVVRGVVSVLLAAALAACGADEPAQPGRSAGASLTWAVETEPITFNPHQWIQNKARLLVFNQFDALVARQADGTFTPWLATTWKISDDHLAYTFDLREDVTFHDGERFDAETVKANLDKLLEPGYNPDIATIQLRSFERAEVVSPYRVKLVLKRPDGLFLDFLSSPYGAQISRKSLKEAKNLKAGGVDVAGTGPFILDRYVQGQEVHYRRNPAYKWPPRGAAHQGPALLSEITYRFLPEAAVRVGALTSGQVDVIEGVPATDIDAITKDPGLTLTTGLNSGTAFTYYFNTSRPPFDDKRVRQAFREAVDLDAVLRSVYRGQAERAWSVVSSASPFYDASLENSSSSSDAAEAASLLDQAGWSRDADGFRSKDGRRLTVRVVASTAFVRDRRDILAQAIQAQVKQRAGIDLQVQILDQGAAQQAWKANEYEIFWNSRGDSDAGAALNLILSSGAAINFAHIDDPRIDGWLKQAAASSDQAERKDLYTRIQRAVDEEAIVFPLYVPADQIAARKSVKGLGFDPASGTPAGAYAVSVDT